MIRNALPLLAALSAFSVAAAPITVRLDNFAYGYGSVDTSAQVGYVGAGEFTGQITVNGQTSSFLTYCTDIYQGFNWATTYNNYELVATGTAHGFTTRQEDLLGKLYTLAGAAVDTTNESAAFQLAVWEIVTESSNSLNILSGSFYLERGGSTTQRNLANSWLTAIDSNSAIKAYSAQRLYSGSTQDFVTFKVRLPGEEQRTGVPEPTSFALAGLALAGLALGRRRKA